MRSQRHEPRTRREPARGGRIARRAIAVVATGACVATSGCASTNPHRFDRAFERGDYAEASAAFVADSTLHDDERALWRVALVHLTPGRATYDPREARDRLQRLIELYPESRRADSARALLALLTEIGGMRTALTNVERRLAATDEEAMMWRAALAHAHPNSETHDPDKAREELGRLMERHPESVYRGYAEALLELMDRLGRMRVAVNTLQRQLDALKAVDLENPPF